LLELVRLEGEQLKTGIELVQGAPVHRLRGQLLPLVYLNRALDVQEVTRRNGAVNIVVLRADERQFGLIVDEVNDTEEIVVKPLGKQLKGINTFAGATIMGDGRVALILDVLGIGQRANVLSELRDRSVAEKPDSSRKGDAQGDRQTLLLFQCAGDSLMALPLSLVSRLEEFPRHVIERTGTQEVVQYRGQIMPLVRISQVIYQAPLIAGEEQKPIQVVVYAEQNRRVGLVVDRILDIVEENLVIERLASRPGIRGSAVIQKRVADVLDVQGVVRAAHPQFFESRPAA
jgi:two-component system chemotaxis sensor kinase CheA